MVLSDDIGGEMARAASGVGAGRLGGGMLFFEGEVGRKEATVEFSGIVFMGLSSGVGVEMGELVSWLESSVVRPGGCCGSGALSRSCTMDLLDGWASATETWTGDSESRP